MITLPEDILIDIFCEYLKCSNIKTVNKSFKQLINRRIQSYNDYKHIISPTLELGITIYSYEERKQTLMILHSNIIREINLKTLTQIKHLIKNKTFLISVLVLKHLPRFIYTIIICILLDCKIENLKLTSLTKLDEDITIYNNLLSLIIMGSSINHYLQFINNNCKNLCSLFIRDVNDDICNYIKKSVIQNLTLESNNGLCSLLSFLNNLLQNKNFNNLTIIVHSYENIKDINCLLCNILLNSYNVKIDHLQLHLWLQPHFPNYVNELISVFKNLENELLNKTLINRISIEVPKGRIITVFNRNN